MSFDVAGFYCEARTSLFDCRFATNGVDTSGRRRMVFDVSKKRINRRIGAFNLDAHAAALIANESGQSKTPRRFVDERAKPDPLNLSENQNDASRHERRLFRKHKKSEIDGLCKLNANI